MYEASYLAQVQKALRPLFTLGEYYLTDSFARR